VRASGFFKKENAETKKLPNINRRRQDSFLEIAGRCMSDILGWRTVTAFSFYLPKPAHNL
jgi:hypothetical protein